LLWPDKSVLLHAQLAGRRCDASLLSLCAGHVQVLLATPPPAPTLTHVATHPVLAPDSSAPGSASAAVATGALLYARAHTGAPLWTSQVAPTQQLPGAAGPVSPPAPALCQELWGRAPVTLWPQETHQRFHVQAQPSQPQSRALSAADAGLPPVLELPTPTPASAQIAALLLLLLPLPPPSTSAPPPVPKFQLPQQVPPKACERAHSTPDAQLQSDLPRGLKNRSLSGGGQGRSQHKYRVRSRVREWLLCPASEAGTVAAAVAAVAAGVAVRAPPPLMALGQHPGVGPKAKTSFGARDSSEIEQGTCSLQPEPRMLPQHRWGHHKHAEASGASLAEAAAESPEARSARTLHRRGRKITAYDAQTQAQDQSQERARVQVHMKAHSPAPTQASATAQPHATQPHVTLAEGSADVDDDNDPKAETAAGTRATFACGGVGTENAADAGERGLRASARTLRRRRSRAVRAAAETVRMAALDKPSILSTK
jgi:hypothetical protein